MSLQLLNNALKILLYLINNYDIKIDTYTCDLSIIKKCKELLEYTNKYKDISVVINAAGFGKIGYAENSIENDDSESTRRPKFYSFEITNMEDVDVVALKEYKTFVNP